MLARLGKYLLLCHLFSWALSNADAQSLPIRWQQSITEVSSFSSPRAVDLDQDQVLDIVIGAGYEGFPSPKGIFAINGLDGSILWQRYTRDQIYGSPLFADLNQDSIPDVIISGRDAQLYALDGSNGSIIWEFWPDQNGSALDSGWYNFYLPQWIPDQDGDQQADLIITNGGDPRLEPIQKDRPPGYLLAISARNGQILQQDTMPDGQETYHSPLVVDFRQNANPSILFGSGGETVGGSYWEVSLQDFMQNGLSQARALLSHPNKGYIAVASLADLNQDAIPEIIIPQLRESLIVLDGASRQELWRIDEPQHDFYVSPSVGQFTGNATPDVFISAFEGNWPFYQTSLQMLIDGQSGQVVWSERGFPYQMASPVALDWDDDGYDELLFARNQDTASTGRYYQHQLYLYDFNDMLFVPIDTARPGLMSFSMPLIVDLEQDQNWELIFATHDNTSDWYLPEGFSLYCVDLGRFAERLAWGGYQGSQGTGFYPQDLILSLPTEPTATITPYPNPVRDRLFVRSAEGELPISIQIYDLQGRLVSQVSAKDNITLTQLSPGMYLYAISMKQQIFRGRFHKQ